MGDTSHRKTELSKLSDGGTAKGLKNPTRRIAASRQVKVSRGIEVTFFTPICKSFTVIN